MSAGIPAAVGRPEARMTVPFTKVYDSGRDFVVARGLQRPIRWGELARTVCAPGSGIGADGLLVITGHQGPDFRVCAYDALGCRVRLDDSAIRSAARAIHHEYGLRRIRLGMSRFRYDVELTRDSVDLLVRHQEVPAGPVRAELGGGRELDFYGIRVGTEHLVACVCDVRSFSEWPPVSDLPRFTLVEVLGNDAVQVRTFDGVRQPSLRSEEVVAAVTVAGYLGRIDRAAGRVRAPDGMAQRMLRPGGAGLTRLSGPGAIVYAGEFTWPFPSVR